MRQPGSVGTREVDEAFEGLDFWQGNVFVKISRLYLTLDEIKTFRVENHMIRMNGICCNCILSRLVYTNWLGRNISTPYILSYHSGFPQHRVEIRECSMQQYEQSTETLNSLNSPLAPNGTHIVNPTKIITSDELTKSRTSANIHTLPSLPLYTSKHGRRTTRRSSRRSERRFRIAWRPRRRPRTRSWTPGAPSRSEQERREGMATGHETGTIGQGGQDQEHGGNLPALSADQGISDCRLVLAEAEG